MPKLEWFASKHIITILCRQNFNLTRSEWQSRTVKVSL